MRRTRILAKLGLMTVLASLTFDCSVSQVKGASSTQDRLRFDAAWWQHTNASEQQGFIYGYQDCRQPPRAAKASIDDYQQAVSAALESEKNSDPNAITKAIEHAWRTLVSRDTRGGENYRGPHGYLDGEWWGGFNGPWPPALALADQGYIEGYLQCSSGSITAQTVNNYQLAINQHYASTSHSRDKIADVLRRLAKLRVS